MAHLIEVAFKGNRKDFFLWDEDDPPPVLSAVIVEAERGEDFGRVRSVGEPAAHRNGGTAHGYGRGLPSRRARRFATAADVARHAELREHDDDARHKALERVRALSLAMKVSDAEWQWDRKKLTFYFTAEKRVDFRDLVRELAAMFRTRIELKQIGVRDEAKRLDGVGRCGRQFCSASWLPELLPVNLGVAKDQRLSLNPSQISGACGRLMCCLRYEHQFYVESRKRFPKEGRLVRTAKGEEKVIANDIFRDRVTLRSSEGEIRTIALDELRFELEQFDPQSARVSTYEPPEPVSLPADDLVLEEAETTVVVEADVGGPVVVIETDMADTGDAPDAPPDVPEGAEPGERRVHRRRGRRGGRRGRGGSPRAGPGPGTPPSPSPGA